jgi:hypothetical protein
VYAIVVKNWSFFFFFFFFFWNYMNLFSLGGPGVRYALLEVRVLSLIGLVLSLGGSGTLSQRRCDVSLFLNSHCCTFPHL